MSTILEKSNITNAKTAIEQYSSECTTLYSELSTIITDLCAKYFIGEASDGFKDFFAQISPALTSNLNGDQNSITAMLNQLLDAVDKALLGTVDPQLGQANKNAVNNQNAQS